MKKPSDQFLLFADGFTVGDHSASQLGQTTDRAKLLPSPKNTA
jgi:hypothetical protein